MNYDEDLQPGDVVSVPFAGVMRHYGVVTFGGRIVSNCGKAGGVISQSFDEFAGGRSVKHHPGGGLDKAYRAEAYAQRRIGGDYSLTGSNCVHFARRAQGKGPTTTQYARATLMALGDMLKRR